MPLTRNDILERFARGERFDRTDLRGIDLARAILRECGFDRADLDGSNLEAAELSRASLRRATLREAYLVGVRLDGANLESADLEGANLERAILVGANLSRANLEGANLSGADLSGAQLGYAQLATAKLGNAKLANANLVHAELDEAYLGGATGVGAKLTSASLVRANLEHAKLDRANFDDAQMRGAILRDADLTGASLVKVDLSDADLTRASLRDTDLRHATLSNAILTGARLTGAKTAGIVGTGSPLEAVEATWLDLSPAGDGTERVENGVIPSVLTGIGLRPAARPRDRYFGRGDVLRDARLRFESGARVEIDSLFQNCTIQIGEQTELMIGASGVLADCEIIGPGNVTIHGKFFERKAPGMAGLHQLSVSTRGTIASAVAQDARPTRFVFDAGCQLRVKIMAPGHQPKHEVKR